MNQLEAMREARLFQHLAGGDEIGRVETELRVLTATGRPFAGTFAVKPDANTDHRFDPAISLMCAPVSLDPVNEMRSTLGCWTRWSPRAQPGPSTRLSTPC